MNLVGLVACPACRATLKETGAGYACSGCGEVFWTVAGIPRLASASEDEHKERQIRFFDNVDSEWEVERPRGAPRLYSWLMEEKFRRSVSSIAGHLPGNTALTVCGGSGMDAEFLARAGADVIVTDLSPRAVERALIRAERHRVKITGIVADIEHLPFADESVDLVYVHDGLHHLEDPYQGLAEMARVARRGISISEPASALVTRVATRVRLAARVEEAGNPVQRLSLTRIESELQAAGFDLVVSGRYAMLYRHYPGWFSWFLSQSGLHQVAVGAFRSGNAIVGRWGNKVAIQAVRVP